MALEVIVLAAGMGTRMHSSKPKVLHEIAAAPMLFHVLRTAASLQPSKIHVVLGHQSEKVTAALATLESQEPELYHKLNVVLQQEQLGTAHAVKQVLPHLSAANQVVILYGDTPLTPRHLLEELLSGLNQHSLTLLTANLSNPTGYGRIIRDASGQVLGIVEEKDATAEQKKLSEVNMGMLASTTEILQLYVPAINNNNAQHEFYLTDLIGLLVQAAAQSQVAHGVGAVQAACADIPLLSGINNKLQLSQVERLYQRQAAERLMLSGVTLADPERFDLRGELICGQDCFIDTNVIIKGKVVLGNNVIIGTGCVLSDVTIGDNSEISPYTIMEKSELKKHTTIGPFARLRPGNILEDEVHIGNFVEVKNSHIDEGTKAGHLTYIGDSDIGKKTNIGAGTITCNYDGAYKHRTTIGNDVFIGSDTQLVAPVTVEDGATVAAGTTVTKTVPANQLVLTRVNPVLVSTYKRPRKTPKA